MKKLQYLLSLFLLIMSHPCLSEKIHLVADEWCPFNCQPNSERPGFMIEIAKLIFEKEGHQIQYSTLPWPRAVKKTRHGMYDGIIGAFRSDAPDFTFPRNNQGSSRNCFYTLQDSTWKYSNLESLDSINLGVINSYSYGSILDDYIQKNKTKSVFQISGKDDLRDRLVKLMRLGRIDAFVEAETVMKYYLHEHFNLKDSIKQVGCFDQTLKLYIAFSPKNKKSKYYANLLSNGTDELRRTGQLAKIMQRYGLTVE